MSAAAAARALMGIGDVLTALRPEFPDITISKIRFLESEGLLQPQRTSSGYRKFSSADVDRLRYVLTCQRDHYLPLKVIRDNLAAIDRGLEPPATGAGGTPRVPRGLADEESLPSPEAFRPAHNDLRLSRAELLAESGLSEKVLEQLESFGIVSPLRHGGSTKHYGAAALDVAGAVARMAEFGIEARHLRQFKVAADREVGLVAQVVTPLAHGRDREAQQRADEAMRQLSALSVRLHAALVRAGLAEALGR